METRSMLRVFAAAFVLFALLALPGGAQDDFFASRPAFSPGDLPAKSHARCEELRAMADATPDPGFRIDLSIVGALTLVRTDGALWYLVTCSDLRVMCVTYESNEMKVGDRVFMKGAYRRIDRNHAILDPCLASSEASLDN
ncbi:MAG TPA: hypothetical protein VFK79_01430 [Xanthobacteraceae bacterium]|nr:hypothetical protein [Xanthobacteraceae bacterium]